MVFVLSGCFRIPQSAEEGKSIMLTEYAKMPALVGECSGMIMTDEELLVHNDGGNIAAIYHLNRNGVDTIKTSVIAGIPNTDWEAMTMYENEIIIGDFGNNLGKRKDLKIHHVDKKTFKVNETIEFAYPDQVSFENPRHNFDCEAIIIKDGKYFLFSKNRGNKNSNIYSAKLRTNSFEFQDSVILQGMVTDAVYHEASNSILLLCYEFVFGGFKNSLAIVKPQRDGGFKTTNIFNIGPAEQFEAITHVKDNQFLIGSETGFGNGRKLYLLTINGI
jgi:hypothetical protein